MSPLDKPLHYSFEVTPADEGERLDRFLTGRLPDMSRSRLQSLIKEGYAVQAGGTIVEPNTRVKPGQAYEITVPAPEPAEPEGENIPLDITFEDDHLIVIDKPAGLVVHPAPGNWSGTLVNALIHHCGDSLSGIGGVRRPGIVHRLDKETSGLMVVAKTDAAHKALSSQFADHGRTGPLVRKYTALVWGVPFRRKDTIKAALGRKTDNRLKMGIVKEGGRLAITHYEVMETYAASEEDNTHIAARVICALETGRTHQIRVHMAHIGHPLLGDGAYGAGFKTKALLLGESTCRALEKLHGQALHAHLLGFAHPISGETLCFESKLPDALSRLHKHLCQYKN